ncbi:hypothetical protein DPMN_140090 [Dreissena polymorpha]|uniref:Uncharacterized protein n=1 Tax=Dreissena polymorpha TaxID=45954 RepID=A0A9D4GAB1_DREPO|nr:hypothetical protein DPMN_140090 [Dreissena polymorpha]
MDSSQDSPIGIHCEYIGGLHDPFDKQTANSVCEFESLKTWYPVSHVIRAVAPTNVELRYVIIWFLEKLAKRGQCPQSEKVCNRNWHELHTLKENTYASIYIA